eukprot:9741401-Heterocapsa_arctica.AAC.1
MASGSRRGILVPPMEYAHGVPIHRGNEDTLIRPLIGAFVGQTIVYSSDGSNGDGNRRISFPGISRRLLIITLYPSVPSVLASGVELERLRPFPQS